MRELVVQKNSSQALEQNDWKEFKPLFGDELLDQPDPPKNSIKTDKPQSV